MNKSFAAVVAAAAVLAANAASATIPLGAVVVPEIDALAGVAALAVVGATVALVRDRMKR